MRFSKTIDCMIVAGTVTYKWLKLFEEFTIKWETPNGLCNGACSTGGMYRSYAVMQGVDTIVPVDVYVSGCPPRPEASGCMINSGQNR